MDIILNENINNVLIILSILNIVILNQYSTILGIYK